MRTTNVNKLCAQLTVFASFASEKSNEFAKTPKKFFLAFFSICWDFQLFSAFLGNFWNFSAFWQSLAIFGLFRHLLGFFDIFRDFSAFFGIFRHFSGFFGIFRDFLAFVGIFLIFRDLFYFLDFFWIFLNFFGNFRHFWEIFGKFLASKLTGMIRGIQRCHRFRSRTLGRYGNGHQGDTFASLINPVQWVRTFFVSQIDGDDQRNPTVPSVSL